VLDDEVEVLEFLRLLLVSLGWEADTASSPEAAFSILEKQPYFLVLTDIAMPHMDGYEFMHEVHRRGINSCLAFMTGFGYDPNHTLVRIRKGHRYPCLFKPFNREKLGQTVQKAWDTYSAGL